MKKLIYYIFGIPTFIFLSVNTADYLMLQRFKSICTQEIELIDKEKSFSNENEKQYNRWLKEKEIIVSIWNNPIWEFFSVINK